MTLSEAPSENTSAAEFIDAPARIASMGQSRGDHPAIIFKGEEISWREFGRHVDQVANALISMGIKPEDKVAILASTSPAYAEMFVGVLRTGACVVPLSGMASAEQLEVMINDSDSRVLMISDSMRELTSGFTDKLENLVPGGRIAADFEADGWQSYTSWRDAAADTAPEIEIKPDFGFNIIYSSGTTGVPKGIQQNHDMRAFHVERFGASGITADTVSLVSTPFYSNTTLVVALPTLAWGGTVVLMEKFNAGEFLKLSEQHKVNTAMLVPVQYQRVLDHEDFDKTDLSAYELKFSTSAPLRVGVKQQIVARWPGKMFEVYGLTEGGGSTILSCTEFPDKLESVGVPGESSEIRLINSEGEELAQGEIGEVVGRSLGMMAGYYKRQDLTDDMLWQSPDGHTFFRTGDMGRFDEDGFLFLLDRIKDMIISGGFNIYAADLEAVLTQHPEVADVAVIGIPSDQWGETPLGLVVPTADATISPQDLKTWTNDKLGKAQRLSEIEYRENLPRSTIGKILKRELREPYWKGVR
jgi:acyl-CoA synthetase (AMP-forming)/AMP-acid ligase II